MEKGTKKTKKEVKIRYSNWLAVSHDLYSGNLVPDFFFLLCSSLLIWFPAHSGLLFLVLPAVGSMMLRTCREHVLVQRVYQVLPNQLLHALKGAHGPRGPQHGSGLTSRRRSQAVAGDLAHVLLVVQMSPTWSTEREAAGSSRETCAVAFGM